MTIKYSNTYVRNETTKAPFGWMNLDLCELFEENNSNNFKLNEFEIHHNPTNYNSKSESND